MAASRSTHATHSLSLMIQLRLNATRRELPSIMKFITRWQGRDVGVGARSGALYKHVGRHECNAVYTSQGGLARRLHPWPIRVMHWTNALAMIVMITSGWGIYNDSVIFGWLHFSRSLR